MGRSEQCLKYASRPIAPEVVWLKSFLWRGSYFHTYLIERSSSQVLLSLDLALGRSISLSLHLHIFRGMLAVCCTPSSFDNLSRVSELRVYYFICSTGMCWRYGVYPLLLRGVSPLNDMYVPHYPFTISIASYRSITAVSYSCPPAEMSNEPFDEFHALTYQAMLTIWLMILIGFLLLTHVP